MYLGIENESLQTVVIDIQSCLWAVSTIETKSQIVPSKAAMSEFMFGSPALCAGLQSLHLQNCLSQFLSEALDLLQQDALPPADVLQLRALFWAQIYWDCKKRRMT